LNFSFTNSLPWKQVSLMAVLRRNGKEKDRKG